MNDNTLYAAVFITLLFSAAFLRADPADTCICAEENLSEYSGRQKRRIIKEEYKSEEDDYCLFLCLKQRKRSGIEEPALISDITERTQKKGDFRLNLFYHSSSLFKKSTGEALDLLELWQEYNKKISSDAARLEEKGSYRELDSLYKAKYSLMDIKPAAALRWAEIKNLLYKYEESAELLCTAARGKGRLNSLSRFKITQYISEYDNADSVKTALETYRKCTLENTGTDAADLYKWLIRTCERMKLFDYEIEAIDSSSFSDHEKASYYFDAAKRSFLNSRYGTAVKAGKRVLNHTNDTSVHKEVAALLYQSYMNRGMKGRALNWMKRSGFKDDPETKRVEITLLQEKGFLDKADSTITELPESPAKDTLKIRNLVFRNKPEDAYELSKKIKKNRRDEGLIWEMRTALYSGKVSTAALLLDSTAYLDNNDYTEERVREKLMIERLKGNRDLLKLYGEIRRLLFTGGFEKAIDTLKNHKAEITEKIPLFETVIEEIQKRDGYSLSLSALQSIPEERFSDKLLFLFGKACIQAGRIQEAETAFKRVIQESGNQVFKRKAGTYLLKIEKVLAM